LPEHIRHSSKLTGNQLGILGCLEEFPSEEEIAAAPVLEESALYTEVTKLIEGHHAHEALCLLIKNLEE